MMLSRLGRWALGLYGPAVPTELGVTSTLFTPEGRTIVRSTPIIPEERRKRLEARQQRQHDKLNELQIYVVETDLSQYPQEPAT